MIQTPLERFRDQLHTIHEEFVVTTMAINAEMRQPLPFIPPVSDEYFKLQSFESQIREVLKTGRRDPLIAYQSLVNATERMNTKIQRGQLVSHFNDIKGAINDVRNALLELRSGNLEYIANLKEIIKGSKVTFNGKMESLKTQADKRIQTLHGDLQNYKNQIKAFQDELKDRISKFKEYTEYISIDDSKDDTKRQVSLLVADVITKQESKVRSIPEKYTDVFGKIDKFNDSIQKLTGKTLDLVKTIHDQRFQEVADRFGRLARRYLQLSRMETALNEAVTEFENENGLVRVELEEMETPVGDTNLTLFEMRREIDRLTKQIGSDELKFSTHLQDLGTEMREFELSSQKVIEELEAICAQSEK